MWRQARAHVMVTIWTGGPGCQISTRSRANARLIAVPLQLRKRKAPRSALSRLAFVARVAAWPCSREGMAMSQCGAVALLTSTGTGDCPWGPSLYKMHLKKRLLGWKLPLRCTASLVNSLNTVPYLPIKLKHDRLR